MYCKLILHEHELHSSESKVYPNCIFLTQTFSMLYRPPYKGCRPPDFI